jgi:hypothetical protein
MVLQKLDQNRNIHRPFAHTSCRSRANARIVSTKKLHNARLRDKHLRDAPHQTWAVSGRTCRTPWGEPSEHLYNLEGRRARPRHASLTALCKALVKGGRQVVFLSSDDESATARAAALVEQLGFEPVGLGRLADGESLVQARRRT